MININTHNPSIAASSRPQVSPPCFASPGQIWKDNNRNEVNRNIIVLSCNRRNVVCQSLSTGKITSVRRKQFNRGKTGFSFVSTLSDLNHDHKIKTINTLGFGYAKMLTKHMDSGNIVSVGISSMAR